MARSWDQMLRPRGVPLWLALFGNTSLFIICAVCLIMMLPYGVVSKVKLLRRVRAYVLKTARRMMELSKEGPFYRLFVHCGRRCCCGRLASRCRPPRAVRAKPTGCNEVLLSFGPGLPLNPFHEESYVLSWCRAPKDGTAPTWAERVVRKEDLEELEGERFRVCADRLPEQATLRFRLCAVNRWGRSEWSDEVTAETFAEPSADGGFTGPLGPAGDGKPYSWAQTRVEVSVKVPIASHLKAKDISFRALPTRLEIRLKGAPADADALLVGTLAKKIKPDEAAWFIEEGGSDGRHIAVQLTKAEAMEKWPCLIEAEGHAHIDTRLVRLFPNGLATNSIDLFE